ncbi:MAG: hypothetical protein ACI84C_000456 [Flavobacteriales bacterium]|jgi:hypothetical protein
MTEKLITQGQGKDYHLNTKISHTILIFLISAMALGFASCSSQNNEAMPSQVMGQERFIEVYTEAILIEAAFKQKMYKTEDPKTWIAKQYAGLFTRENISSDVYDASFDWYSTHPEILLDIYSEVIENLGKLEAKQNAETNP